MPPSKSWSGFHKQSCTVNCYQNRTRTLGVQFQLEEVLEVDIEPHRGYITRLMGELYGIISLLPYLSWWCQAPVSAARKLKCSSGCRHGSTIQFGAVHSTVPWCVSSSPLNLLFFVGFVCVFLLMITIIGGDFTRSWLSLPLSHGIKVKGKSNLGRMKMASTQWKTNGSPTGSVQSWTASCSFPWRGYKFNNLFTCSR